MNTAKEISSHQFLCDGMQFIREGHDVIAVPAHPPTDMKQDPIEPSQGR